MEAKVEVGQDTPDDLAPKAVRARRPRPEVVIVGGGFAGLRAAKELRKRRVRVTLIDRRNHHLFLPLLYQVATGGLAGTEIAAPLRRVLRTQRNAHVVLGEVTRIDLERHCVVMADAEVRYDYLIVAAGSENDYFGHQEWAVHAPGLKSLWDAHEVRRRLLLAYECAERLPEPLHQREWMTVVIVGGGPTGVELAGAIAEIARHTLARDFRRIDSRETRIVLIEGKTLLPSLPEALREEAKRELEARGVEVLVGEMVSEITSEGVRVGDRWIAARTILWAAGVQPASVAESFPRSSRGARIRVERDLSVPGHPEVFVVGDMMAFEQEGRLLPGVAQVAIQSGRAAAHNVLRRIGARPTLEFFYRDKGELATIGRFAAVGRIGRVSLRGRLGWFVWWAIHIMFLIGFRNRIAVLFDWFWAYATWQRSAHVILPSMLDLSSVKREGSPERREERRRPPASPRRRANGGHEGRLY